MRSFILVIISLFSINSYAQVSGFLGKKNIISGSLFMKSSFIMPNKNGKSGYFSFNDHYSLEYERVINRRSSVKLHMTSFESMFDLKLGSIYTYDNYNSFTSKAFGADYVIYGNSYIAPLGAYLSGGFDVFFNNISIDTASRNNNIDILLGSPRFDFTECKAVHFGVNLKSGVKQIFFNCISLDINFQMGCIFSKPNIDDVYFDTLTVTEDYIANKVGTRLWGHYLWGVNCSIGYVF